MDGTGAGPVLRNNAHNAHNHQHHNNAAAQQQHFAAGTGNNANGGGVLAPLMRPPHSSSIKRGDSGSGGGGGADEHRSSAFGMTDGVEGRASPSKSHVQNNSSNLFPRQQPPRQFGIGSRSGGGGENSVLGGGAVEGFSPHPSTLVGGPRWENSLPTIKSDGSFSEDSPAFDRGADHQRYTGEDDGLSAAESGRIAAAPEDRRDLEMQQLQQQQQQQRPVAQRLFFGSGVGGLQRRSSPAGSFVFGGGASSEMGETPPRTPTSIAQFWNNATKGLGLGGGGGAGTLSEAPEEISKQELKR